MFQNATMICVFTEILVKSKENGDKNVGGFLYENIT